MADARPIGEGPIFTKPAPWHWWVTIDLVCSSLGAGLFSVAAILYLLGGAQEQAVARSAFILDFPVMLIDLVCLIFDLGDPYRFMNMLRVFKPGSPMSVGVWTIAIFSFASFGAFAIVIVGLAGWILTTVAIAGLPFALMVGIYKGVLFSTTAQPGWRAMRWLGAWFSISAGLLGVAVALAIAAVSRLESAATVLRTMLLMLMMLYAVNLIIVERESDDWTRHARTRSRVSVAIAVVIGFIVPIVVITLSSGALEEDCAAALLVVGAIAIRHVLVMIPHHVAAK